MSEEKKGKVCENCGKTIPDDFVNLLCWDCYNKQQETKEEKKEETYEARPFDLKVVKNGITDPNYTENEEAEDKEQWLTNVMMFQRHKVMLWKPTRQMYSFIRDWCLDQITAHPQYPKFIWRPKIVDVGCGCGVGANVLSLQADIVWGIDKNEGSVRFAKECFERVKNSIYYSAQVSFDHFDIFEDTRETAKFDVVTCIEIIEHINDYKLFLKLIIEKFTKTKGDPTKFFISTPNRTNKHIKNESPGNKYHCREWTAPEFYNVLSEFFNNVKFHNAIGVEIHYEEIKETNHTPLLALCWNPK